MQKILITSPSVARTSFAGKKLIAAGLDINFANENSAMTETALISAITGCVAMIAGGEIISEKVIRAGSPTLKLIARSGVGYDNVDLKAAAEYGVNVTITPNANTYSVAEMVMGLMISQARSIPVMDRQVRTGHWKRIVGNELYQKKLGIIGTGKIGVEVAKRAKAFGMEIMAYDLYPNEMIAKEYALRYMALEELLPEADFVTIHVPPAPDGPLINRRALDLMKPTAYLINTARGQLVDEDALYDALKNKKIAGAGLDVFSHEPLTESKLFELENVIFSPHVAGATNESVYRMGLMAAEEVLRVASGEPPMNVVSLQK